jgi:hypothetical protein
LRWCIALCSAACGRVAFDAQVAGDAPQITVGCTMPATVVDSFDTSPPCAAWGILDEAMATVTVAGGELMIAPEADQASTRGGCIATDPMPFDPQIGMFAKISTPPDSDEYAVLQWNTADYRQLIGWTMVPTPSIQMQRIDMETMQTTTLGELPYDPAMDSWGRLRPTADGTAIMSEYSADGTTWHLLAVDPDPPPATVKLELYAGTFTADATPMTVAFDSVDVCP